MGMTAWRAIAAALLLAGCSGAGGWSKPGADAADVTAALHDCRAVAEQTVGTEERIDEDIQATRQTDWDRSQIGGLASAELGEETRGRAAGVVASCMRAKGFIAAR
jgi:hypothetical protein